MSPCTFSTFIMGFVVSLSYTKVLLLYSLLPGQRHSSVFLSHIRPRHQSQRGEWRALFVEDQAAGLSGYAFG